MGNVQLVVHQDPRGLFCKAAFHPVSPQPVLVHVFSPLQVQDLAFPIVELQEAPLCPLLWPVKVPLY